MSARHRVVHMASNHGPFDIRIFMKECRTLAAHGYRVTFIVPHEADAFVDGVTIRAVPKPRTRRERMTRTAWQVYRAAAREDADIYHVHDPELVLYAWLLKLRGKRIVYDVHEHRPKQVLSKKWIRPGLRAPIAWCTGLIEQLTARAFDRTIAVTASIARQFPAERTSLVQNFPIEDELVAPPRTHDASGGNAVAFVGGISEIRGIEQMIAALELVPVGLDARLVLAGTFSSARLESDVRAMPGWDRVRFLGWQSRSDVAGVLAGARAGLLLYHPEPNHVDAQPNKLFEYMSAGVPVIASAFPLWKEIVEGAACGLTVDPLDPRAIADAIVWMLTHPSDAKAMGARGRLAVQARFNWTSQAEELLRVYEGLTA